MSSPSPKKQRAELRAILDFIINGPGPDKDMDAVQALVGLGRLVGAARWAIDHEMGRVLAGRHRSSGYFVLGDERLPIEARQDVIETFEHLYGPETVAEWERAGRLKGNSDQQRALMSAVMHALGWGSGDRRFSDLAWALDMLEEGEAPPLLRPRKPPGGRGGHGAPAQITRHRLRAVLGVMYLRHVGAFESARAARKKVASFYGVTPEAMEKWPALIKRVIGAEALEKEFALAAFMGLAAARLKRWPREGLKRGEQTFGLTRLKADGEQFQRLQRRGKRSVMRKKESYLFP